MSRRETVSSPLRVPLSTLALAATCVGYAMVILDTTVVNVALPELSRDLHASTTGLQWVVDSYTLVFAAFLLSAGALGDRCGSKGVFMCGLGLFCLASLACGLAPSTPWLVVARLIQGLGAAVAVPSSLALLLTVYPERIARARAIGLWGGMAGVAAGMGPILGGALVDILGWRSVFFINLPIGGVGLLLGARYLPRPSRHSHGIDLAGQAAAVTCLVGLAAALIEAGPRGWTSPIVVAGFVVFVGTGGLFLVIERRVRRPLLPLALFSSPTLSAATAVGLCANLGFFGELFVVSIYLQQVRGLSPLLTGLALSTQMVSTIAGSVVSGRVMARVGPRLPMLVGLSVAGGGLLGLAAASSHSQYWTLLPCFVAAGLGISFAMMAATAAVMEAVPHERGGIASGTLNSARQVGGMIGVALLGGFVADRATFLGGLHLAMVVAGGVFLVAAVVTALFVDRHVTALATEPTSVGRST